VHGRLVIEAGWVVTVDPQFRTIRNGAVLIEDGLITGAGPAAGIDRTGAAVLRFPRHVLLPGLVNGHTHVAGAVFRGLLEDRPDHFYGFALPMEAYLTPETVYRISRVGVAELLLAGCTVMNDMFHDAAQTARAVAELGIRAQLAHKVFDADLPGIGAGRREYHLGQGLARLERNIELYQRWHGEAGGRIEVRFGLHAPDTCSPQLQAWIRDQAAAHAAGVHTHVSQSKGEHDYVQARYGRSSAELLAEHGLLGPATIAVHLLFASPGDVGLLASTGTPVAHCPACVTKVAGLLGPFRDIYQAGITVGWGTDWVSMDPWDAMRFGIVGLRLAHHQETLLSAREALWRFTMGSATILGWQDRLGSLEPGKKADLILVDADQPHLAPMHDPVTTLVYNASGRDVTHVMIDGRFVVDRRTLCTGSLSEIIGGAQAAAEEFWQRSGQPLGLPRL
jgi:5-methylthioadenosine/S-adenosylhomocysteine deaminase